MGTYTGHDRIDHNVVFRLLPDGHDGFAQCRQRIVRIGLDHNGDANHVIGAITHTVLAVLRLVIVHSGSCFCLCCAPTNWLLCHDASHFRVGIVIRRV